MALLTATEMRGFVETDLTDASLQVFLDAAEQRINDFAGSVAQKTETFDAVNWRAVPHGRHLWLAQKPASFASVVERCDYESTPVTLAADDYEVDFGSRLVRRDDGTNPESAWAPLVAVTYTPQGNTAQRKAVQVELVKIALRFQGVNREDYGDMEMQVNDREALIRTALAPLLGQRPMLL